MREAMGENALKHNTPHSEIAFVYKEEISDFKNNGKHVVEMNKERPTWWPNNLLSKPSKK